MSVAALPIRLIAFDELDDPGSRGFDPAGQGRDTLLLVRCDGEVFAYLDACPHYGGTPMAWRKDAYLNGDGTRIVCHAHGAQFDIATGECLVGPCLGQRLTRLDTTVTEDGDVSVFMPPGSASRVGKEGEPEGET
ncbi:MULTISPECIES: Rieske (2Fe-2S) protein [Paraburkholderia]|uniref:Rieske (2Fe-2S) protein n=1 Tax=Paraburkholderia TaxID=1822464 RepID=UPI000382B2A4|nr:MULTISPECIES: Rieske 2Fe-2S domain-containing protein [Paraburkholderia]MDH6153414.1 nitrite reductase/ring-hydroxylating ferredoxin subunit [Paraburkholderia sp. WSM4179]